MKHGENEAFSRILIDKALEFSGWNLLQARQVRFELNGATGRADYLLSGQRGPLCVVEAKREDLDPYDAKEQGRGYAEISKLPSLFFPMDVNIGFGITLATTATPIASNGSPRSLTWKGCGSRIFSRPAR